MFKNTVPLTYDQHARLRFEPQRDYWFSKNEMLVPVFFSEVWRIAREYVILFPKASGGMPLALLGTRQNENAYVDTEPVWWGRYVPAHIRRYPFLAALRDAEGEAEGKGGRTFAIMVDADAPHLSYDKGEPLFDEQGQPSALLKNIQNVLRALQQDIDFTTSLMTQIEKAGVLAERSIAIKRAGDEPAAIKGFRTVDRSALLACSDKTLKELMQSGALDLLYAHIGSHSNLQDGLLAKKIREEDARSKGTPDIEALFGGEVDIFKFDA